MKVVLHTICRVRMATHLLGNAVLANTMGIAKGRTNVIGALFASCLLTATLFTRTVNADVFFAWLSQDLLPKLSTNSVIVMDNAPRTDFQHLIEQQGHLLEFLPPYSPDLNPIEHKWVQAKALRRQKNVLLTSCLLSSFRSFYTALAIFQRQGEIRQMQWSGVI